MKVTYEVRGDRVMVTALMPAECVLVEADGAISVAMEDTDWRRAARAILRECNAAELRLPSATVAERVRESLADAVKRALEADPRAANLRAASSVLHRLADLIQGGTVGEVSVRWSIKDPTMIAVEYASAISEVTHVLDLELGRGVVGERVCNCPHVDGVHEDACASR